MSIHGAIGETVALADVSSIRLVQTAFACIGGHNSELASVGTPEPFARFSRGLKRRTARWCSSCRLSRGSRMGLRRSLPLPARKRCALQVTFCREFPVVTVVADGRVYTIEEFAKTMVDVEAA
jgi:hypothetical protein